MTNKTFLLNQEGEVVFKADDIRYSNGIAVVRGIFYPGFTEENSSIVEMPYVEVKPSVGEYDTLVLDSYTITDGTVTGNFTVSIQDLAIAKESKRLELKGARDVQISESIDGIAVSRSDYREDIKQYSELLSQYAASTPEEQAVYADMINPDGTINWILEDNTVRAVSKEELDTAYQTYFIRKGQLMAKYKAALAALYAGDVTTSAQIESINLGDF